MLSADRAALAKVTATLLAAGFESYKSSRRTMQTRPGFTCTFIRFRAMPAGVYLFDNFKDGAKFAAACAALQAAGYTLTDSSGGSEFVTRGCARVRRAT